MLEEERLQGRRPNPGSKAQEMLRSDAAKELRSHPDRHRLTQVRANDASGNVATTGEPTNQRAMLALATAKGRELRVLRKASAALR